MVCNVNELNQVFLDLIVNAAHAIGEDTPAGCDECGTIRVRTARENGSAIVEISDTGPGIPHEIRERIFDPFFTTKDVGRGTGQGLAIARAIVDRHGGSLTHQPAPGRGTKSWSAFRSRASHPPRRCCATTGRRNAYGQEHVLYRAGNPTRKRPGEAKR